MQGSHRRVTRATDGGLWEVAFARAPPGPGVAEPERREQMKSCRFPATISHADAYQDVVGRGLRVFGEDVEVSILVEDARVRQFKFALCPSTTTVLFNQLTVREFRLWVLVE